MFGLSTLSLFAETPKQPNHNGNWWRESNSAFHTAFVSGYKAGAHHVTSKPTPLYNFTAEELSTGLDTFYQDFRNRNIQVDDALPLVGDQLSGASDTDINAHILKLRAAAAQLNANKVSE